MTRSILLLGATGLFGGHLARQLSTRDDISLSVAGRSPATLNPLAQELGAQPFVLDRTRLSDCRKALRDLKPFAVIDCSGPFQSYGAAPYGFARVVLEAGAHYLDIADGAQFVAGITELDSLARDLSLCAFSGASTTPALSSAIAADLAQGLDEIELIETTILPGNRTPRGLSVMRAILGQVGQPFARRRGGRVETSHGWADSIRVAPRVGAEQLKPRLAALVHTPDVSLFARHFGAATITARAGLEVTLFHRALTVGRYLVPALGVRSLEPLSKPLLKISNLFLRVGSDAGGMRVRVCGLEGARRVERIWDMIIPDGHGPKTPVQPVIILLEQLLAGKAACGARPALAAFTRAQAEAQLATIQAKFERRDREVIAIFAQALGPTFAELPLAVQVLHSPAHTARFKGRAQVETARHWLARIAAVVGGFPITGGDVAATVEITARDNSEVWRRNMGRKSFRSTLRYDPDHGMSEQFGPMVFGLNLKVDDGALHFPVTAGRAFGLIPIPKVLTPISETREAVDAQGRFTFDVRLSLPNGALIVHYRGYLEPQ